MPVRSMGLGGPPRESSAALTATMVDLRAGEHQAHSPDQTLFQAAWRPGWRDWLAVGVVVAAVAVTIGIVLSLR